jgi:gamma-glutamyltranspeptidase/glutathione hydrolase
MVVTCEVAACEVPGRAVGGFLLNNSLNGFSRGTSPGVRYNAPEGGKRPRSDMSPTLVFSPSGTPRLVVGSAGGGRIPAIVFEVISSVIDHGKSIQEAISAPRFVNENLAQRTTTVGHYDTRHETPPFNLPQTLVDQLRNNKGQRVIRNTITFGAAQGIAIDPDTGALSRGVDPRRGGDF